MNRRTTKPSISATKIGTYTAAISKGPFGEENPTSNSIQNTSNRARHSTSVRHTCNHSQYREELKEWKMANTLASRVILGAISKEVRRLVDPEEPGKYMYDKLKAEVVKQSSGSSANCKRIELV